VSNSDDAVREGLSSVTRGTLFLLVATIAYVGINFVSRVIVVRNTTPGEWNAFSLALTLAGVISALGTLGLPNAIARSLPYATGDPARRSMVRGTLVLSAVAGAVGAIGLFFAAPALGSALGSANLSPANLTLALQLFSVTIATSVVATVVASIFQGYEDVTPNGLFVQIINPALFVGFLVVYLALPPRGLSYGEALTAYAAANVASLALILVYMLRRLPRRLPAGVGDPKALRQLLTFAAPLFVVGVMSTLMGSGDTLVLGVYHSSEVGTYSASLTLSRLLTVGMTAAAYIFLPVATRFHVRRQTGSVDLTYTTVTKWMILLSLPLFLVFFFVPSESLDFVYGISYTAVTLPLDLTVFGAFVTTLLGPGPTVQVAFGRTRLLLYNAVAAGSIDVGLAFALVPTWGYVGAAVAWGTANAAYSALSIAEIAVLDRVHPFRQHFVLPLLVTGVPSALALYLARPFLAVHSPLITLPPIALGIAGLFLVVVLVTRSVDVGDAMLLDAVERMLGRPLPWVRRLGRLGLRRALNGARR